MNYLSISLGSGDDQENLLIENYKQKLDNSICECLYFLKYLEHSAFDGRQTLQRKSIMQDKRFTRKSSMLQITDLSKGN